MQTAIQTAIQTATHTAPSTFVPTGRVKPPQTAVPRTRVRPIANLCGAALTTMWVVASVTAMNVAHRTRTRRGAERGQTTAEYALVLLGAATVAMLLIAWAGSTGRVGTLFNRVLDAVTSRVA